MVKIFLIYLLLLTTGCGGLHQDLKPVVFYPRDIKLEVNGRKGVGMLVVPQAQAYFFSIESPGKLDMLLWSNCHQAQYQEEAWGDGWFASKYKASFKVFTSSKRELKDCPILLQGYEKVKGRNSTAEVVPEDSDNTIGYYLQCNGSKVKTNGVGACTTKAGLVQELEFPFEVVMADNFKDHCPAPKSKDGKSFSVEIGRGDCVYKFVSKERDVNTQAILKTYGWDEPVIRGD
jgi:hypothetical protein